jgi:hypothetical protein
MRGTAHTGMDRRALISGMTAASALGGVIGTGRKSRGRAAINSHQ